MTSNSAEKIPTRALIAPDAFKGTLRATEVAVAISSGLQASGGSWQTRRLPLADGGEGTLDAWLTAVGGLSHAVRVQDIFGVLHSEHIGLGAELGAELGEGRDAVLVESALFCGRGARGDDELDPVRASSYGLGQAIAAALEHRPRKLLVGLGGTVTVDAGGPMLQALARALLGRDEAEIPGRETVAALRGELARRGVELIALCDVQVPLAGAAMFMPQKGAGPAAMTLLEARLERARETWAVADRPGAGAAGGLGYGLVALGAELVPGADALMDLLDVDRAIAEADLVITGEGRLDAQTAQGKLIARLLRRCQAHGKPVHAICGQVVLNDDEVQALGLQSANACPPGRHPPFVRLRQAAMDLARDTWRITA